MTNWSAFFDHLDYVDEGADRKVFNRTSS